MTTFQGKLPMIVRPAFDPSEWAGDELRRAVLPRPRRDGNRRERRAAEARARKQGGDNG